MKSKIKKAEKIKSKVNLTLEVMGETTLHISGKRDSKAFRKLVAFRRRYVPDTGGKTYELAEGVLRAQRIVCGDDRQILAVLIPPEMWDAILNHTIGIKSLLYEGVAPGPRMLRTRTNARGARVK